jgi:Ca2+-binding EF-hand superfamily protein
MQRLIPILCAGLLAAVPAAQGQRGDPDAVWKHLRESYDKDQDGAVSKQEYPRGDDKFARFDRDGDGKLTAADFERGAAAGRDEGRGRGERGAQRGGGMRDMLATMVGPELYKAADADRNGNVSTAEWKAFVDGLGADEDGNIESGKLPFGRSGMGRQMTANLRTVDDLDEVFARLDADRSGSLERGELGDLPIAGDVAPDFELPFADDDSKTVKLSSYKDDRPVALIFGSYT